MAFFWMSLNILKFFPLNDKKNCSYYLALASVSVYLSDMADSSRKVNESEQECFHWYADGSGVINSQFDI